MGTRGVTEVIYNDKIVVSQYGQWDHYPSGQGVTILNFLSNPLNIEKLQKNLELHLTYQASDEELKKIYANYFREDGRGSLEDGERFSKDYPSLTRDTGAGILEVIANTTDPVPLVLEPAEFKDDRLFCEGVFTINLDDNTFTTRYNRYQNENDEDVLTLTFQEVREITNEDYCEKARCGVYSYYKESQAV
jgi:hypothetical protein